MNSSNSPISKEQLLQSVEGVLRSQVASALWKILCSRPNETFSVREIHETLHRQFVSGQLTPHKASHLERPWESSLEPVIRKFLRERLLKSLLPALRNSQDQGLLPKQLPFEIQIFTQRQGSEFCRLSWKEVADPLQREMEHLQNQVVSRSLVVQTLFRTLLEKQGHPLAEKEAWELLFPFHKGSYTPKKLSAIFSGAAKSSSKSRLSQFRSYCLETIHKGIITPLETYYQEGNGRFDRFVFLPKLYRYNEAPALASLSVLPNPAPGNLRNFTHGPPAEVGYYLPRGMEEPILHHIATGTATVLYGQPGTGKTTLVRHLLATKPGLLSGLSLFWYTVTGESNTFHSLVLELARFLVACHGVDERPFQFLLTQSHINEEALTNRLVQALSRISCLLALDDLHLALNSLSVVNLLEALAANPDSQAKLLVVSRTSLVEVIPSFPEESSFFLEGFETPETIAYLKYQLPSYASEQLLNKAGNVIPFFEGNGLLLSLFCQWWEQEQYRKEALQRFFKYRVRGALREFCRKSFTQCTSRELEVVQWLNLCRRPFPLKGVDILFPGQSGELQNLLNRGILVQHGNRVLVHGLFQEFSRAKEVLTAGSAPNRQEIHRELGAFRERIQEFEEALYHYQEAGAFDQTGRLLLLCFRNGWYCGSIESLLALVKKVTKTLKPWSKKPEMASLLAGVAVVRYGLESLKGNLHSKTLKGLSGPTLKALSPEWQGIFWLMQLNRGLREGLPRLRQKAFRRLEEVVEVWRVKEFEPVLHAKKGLMALNTGDGAVAKKHLSEAWRLVENERHSLIKPEITRDLGRLYFSAGNYKEAEKWFQSALSACRQSGNAEQEAVNLESLGVIAMRTGQAAEALKLFQQAESLVLSHGAYALAGSIYGNMGVLHHTNNQFHLALENYERAISKKYRVSDLNRATQIHALAADTAMRLGKLDKGRELVETLTQGTPWEETAPGVRQFARHVSGLVYRGLREWEAAKGAFEQALELCRKFDIPDYQHFNLFSLGSLLVEMGQAEAGTGHLEEGKSGVKKPDDVAVACQYHLARALFVQGKEEEGLKALDTAMHLARQLEDEQALQAIRKLETGWKSYRTVLNIYGI